MDICTYAYTNANNVTIPHRHRRYFPAHYLKNNNFPSRFQHNRPPYFHNSLICRHQCISSPIQDMNTLAMSTPLNNRMPPIPKPRYNSLF